MLFNSYLFLLGFLPLAAALFYAFGRVSRSMALHWLTLASLAFYAWWRPLNVAIILPSILINFALARRLQRLGGDERQRGAARWTLVLGIALNVCFLGYFKYWDFFTDAVNDAFGTQFVLTHIVLPLGISFITFQKIAFLIDVHGGRIKSFDFSDYALFVLFFPQLIAGPIVHYREVMPQFHKASCRFNATDVGVGLTMFCFGLFKKAFLADSIAPLVSPIFARAAAGDPVSLLPALMAAVGFTLQIYFDFSGYSDMAIGIARLFGIKLPANFDSPLRATSIIDYWLRWHITLSRFLTAYVYNPLLLWRTRARLARGKPALGGRNVSLGAYLNLLVLPTMVTMFVSGLWHGAGYTFIVWGLLHGVFLSINHGWRLFKTKRRKGKAKEQPSWSLGAFALTFLSVVVAMVFFKSSSMHAAWSMLQGMVGAHGIGLPKSLFEHVGPLADLMRQTGGGPEAWWGAQEFMMLTAWIIVMLGIAWFCPNSAQLLGRYEPALGVRPVLPDSGRLAQQQWQPSLRWAAVVSAVAFAAVLRLGGPSEFLYWQF